MKNIELFLDKVSPVPWTGCWLWTATSDQSGYGMFGIGGSGNTNRAHRLSYEHFVGPIPPGMMACHVCDTPSCVNPDHIFIGTPADNSADRDRKGHVAVGARNGKSKVSDDEVRFIRQSSLSERKIAKVLGFHRGTINAIRSGRTWGHLV